jgi:hypothetical protein
MNHQPFEDWLLEETPLDRKQRLELEVHLRKCSYCNGLAESGKALGAVKRVSPAAGFSARFQARLAHQRAMERRRRLWGSLAFTVGGLLMLIWLAGPYLAAFLASPATWITVLTQWVVYVFTTVRAIGEAGFVVLDILPSFLSPLTWMIVISAVAGMVLLWSVSIWRLAQRNVSQGV